MKIAIDIRPLLEPYHSGVQEYIINLLTNIFKIDKKNDYILFSSGLKDIITDKSFSKFLTKISNVKRKHLFIPNKILNRLFQFKLYFLDNFLETPDIFFAPNICYFSIKKAKIVVTFHDLSFEHFPEFYSWDRKIFHFLTKPKHIAQIADKIIAVSQSTKQDLIDLYQIRPEKISVIYSGINTKYEILNSKDYLNLPKNFILYLGTIEPRKNIESIIKGFEMLENFNDLYLIIAGPKGWGYKKVFDLASNSFKKDRIIFLGPVLPEKRYYLYQKAKVFIWPSFFEGFGFPPLEAAVLGTPAIAANNSSLPEIASNNAILINSYRPKEIYLALKQILLDQNLKNHLSKNAPQHLKTFNWENTAKETLEVFKSLKQ